MAKMKFKICLGTGMLLFGFYLQTGRAQDMRWLRIGETQCFYYDYGAEGELTTTMNFFTWPTQYGDNQHTERARSLWMGARDFYDPVEKKIKSVKVIGAGPRVPANQFTMIFPQSIKLIGKYYHPTVIVDDQIGTNNTLYDKLDEFDPDLPCDRMIVIRFNTSMGVSVTKKVMAFSQQNHDNYHLHEYVFKNTGIYNEEDDVYQQTLKQFWVHWAYRYAFAGVTTSGWGSVGWGAFGSEWGNSTLYRAFGESPTDVIKGFYAWYGPSSDQPISYEEDWGCPHFAEDGQLGSAKYTGVITLHADKSPKDTINDLEQPRTTSYFSPDETSTLANVSQYDESFMELRWRRMTEGHPEMPLDELVGEGKYVSDLVTSHPEINLGGGVCQGQGFGPYTLEPGDSIRIVFAEGANGLDWIFAKEVGAKWFAYYKGTGTPPLVLPDGTPTSDHNLYKRKWVETGADSIMKTLLSARENYLHHYQIPQPPPPPEEFVVTSGGDRIRLTWADNAMRDPHFDGYVIYRSEGTVKDYRTVYTKIFECNKENVVHSFDDTTAVRGFDYYYYIQSKDDGTQNELEPGKPLYSSLFLTLTSVPARLLRPAGSSLSEVRVVPNPYDIRARAIQFGEDAQYDRIAFYGLPPFCKLRIYTERGDLIWEKDHTNGAGDEIWDSMTKYGQIVASGIYVLYVEVTEEGGGFKKGESVYRKFVVIR